MSNLLPVRNGYNLFEWCSIVEGDQYKTSDEVVEALVEYVNWDFFFSKTSHQTPYQYKNYMWVWTKMNFKHKDCNCLLNSEFNIW